MNYKEFKELITMIIEEENCTYALSDLEEGDASEAALEYCGLLCHDEIESGISDVLWVTPDGVGQRGINACIKLVLPEMYREYDGDNTDAMINNVTKLLKSLRNLSVKMDVEASINMLTPKEQETFEKLRNLRAEIAKREKVPLYWIFNNRALVQMCRELPLTELELMRIKGIGIKKTEKYGGPFLEVLREAV